MENYDIYKDIEKRTNGDIYIGVVGPVRTGKSTFVSKFMELSVIPNIADSNKKTVAVDEMPQSGGGKTIMTTEPKFVPGEAVEIKVAEGGKARVRVIDCVGYMVEGSLGQEENGAPRLIKTPWSDKEMPFQEAAEYGTEKVIKEHSTIGVAVTSDGSFTDLTRAAYEKAEQRVISELKQLGKPFIILLNVKNPASEKSAALKAELESKYSVPVTVKNATALTKDDIDEILSTVLLEFPVRKAAVNMPKWMRTLPEEGEIIGGFIGAVKKAAESVRRMGDYKFLETALEDMPSAAAVSTELNLGEGIISMSVEPADGLFYSALAEESGEPINDEFDIIRHVSLLKKAKRNYEKLKGALDEAEQTGYGIVAPAEDEISLSEPEMVKNGNNYGLKIKATAPTLHIMRVDIGAEVNSVVGKEQQCRDYVESLKKQYSENPLGIMKVDLFGRPLYGFVADEIFDKAGGMKNQFREKIRKTVGKIVNEKKSALICLTF